LDLERHHRQKNTAKIQAVQLRYGSKIVPIEVLPQYNTAQLVKKQTKIENFCRHYQPSCRQDSDI
jgi:hypothetical protein